MAELKVPIQSTAGAVPVKNEKGEVTMQKVKVNRYVTGKRPEYAPQGSSDEEDADFIQMRKEKMHDAERQSSKHDAAASAVNDRRLNRLQSRPNEDGEGRYERHHRRVEEPEVIGRDSDEEGGRDGPTDSEQDEEDVDEEEIVRRREILRERARSQRHEEEAQEMVDKVDDEVQGSSEESEESQYEEYTDSEEEDGPRLKPIFVRKKDRITIQEKQKQVFKERELELEAKRLAEERKLQARKLVEQAARQELEQDKNEVKDLVDTVNTDDENDEEEYEAWKVRELRRMKRDREEREALEKEKQEVERLRNLTEEERKLELKLNPKKITNQMQKEGKYKFLQKYYHRGAFFLDNEEDVLKRDYTAPTLEDHFDKTVLPKVMQVKNFGRSGRTKYTHLVDQDTTSYESPWAAETSQNIKFVSSKGGGMKQNFEKPTSSRKKN